jgi:CubicO group peptidase (beta-lactamase class C family)
MKMKLNPGYISRIALCAAALVMFASTRRQKENAEIKSPSIIATVDVVVKEELAKQNLIGVVVGVVQNGNITHVKAYGHTNEARTTPMTTSTVLRWASISKTVTAVAAFKAIEDGKMALTDKVTKYVPYWPTSSNKDDITIAQLLSHRAGIVHYGNDENGNSICNYNAGAYTANNNFNAEQSVNVFKNCNLAFTPGTDYCYSTFGFNLLGAAIEGATGKPYEIYVDDNISDKAGMASMTGYSSDPGGYTKDCNTFIKSDPEGEVEWKLPGGGWASNINDMTDFLKGLINGTFLSNTAALWPTVPGNGAYRYGINKEMLGSKVYVSHGGAHDDVRTHLGFFPADKTGVCVMINHGEPADAERLAKLIQNAIGYTWSVTDRPIDYCGSSDDCGQTMTAVWRNTGNADDIVLRRGYTTDEFHEEWEILMDAGYYADNIETWMDGLVRKWDGIFKKTTKKSAMWRGFTTDGWHDKWEEMNNQGYRLIDLETYLDGTVRKWAGTFIESSDSYAMYRGYSTDDFGDKHSEMQAENRKLVDVETYLDGTVRKWAGVWKGSGTSLLNRNYNEGDFMNLCIEREKAGYKLLDVETYMDGLVRKWAGVWEKADGDEHFYQDRKMSYMINNYHNVLKVKGYELMDIEKY